MTWRKGTCWVAPGVRSSVWLRLRAAVLKARPRNEAAPEGVEPPTCFSSLGRGAVRGYE